MSDLLPLPNLIVDSRESRSDVPRWLTKLGYETSTAELQVGDYHAPGLVIVERKTSTDFVLSMMDGRLFGQAEMLANHDDLAIMVVEGVLEAGRSVLDPDALPAALAALTGYYGLNVVGTSGPEMTARFIGRKMRQMVNGLGYHIGSSTGKPKIDGAMSQFLLEGLPGVGPQMARHFLAHFGSAAAVFAASVEELQRVKGVGAKTALAIFNAVHHKPTAFRDTKGPSPGRLR